METEDATIKRMVLPWDNNISGGVPFHLYRWWANTGTGTMCMLDRDISREQNPDTMQMETVVNKEKGEYLNRLQGEQVILDMADMTAIYQISATHDIGLMQALVKHMGTDNFSPQFMEKCEEAPLYKANEKYAVGKPKGEPVVLKKPAAKKKAGRPKGAKNKPREGSVAEALLKKQESLGDPEE